MHRKTAIPREWEFSFSLVEKGHWASRNGGGVGLKGEKISSFCPAPIRVAQKRGKPNSPPPSSTHLFFLTHTLLLFPHFVAIKACRKKSWLSDDSSISRVFFSFRSKKIVLACVVTGLGLLLPRCGGCYMGFPYFPCKRKKKKRIT